MLEKQEWDCFPTTSLGTKALQMLKGVPSNNIQWPPREWHWSYEIGSCISHGQLMGIGQSHQISVAVPKIDRYDVFRISIKSKFRLSVSCSPMASHAVIVRVSTHVPAPLTSAKLTVKSIDQSQHTSRPGKCTLRNFAHARLSSRKDQKGLERWRPYTFRTNYSVNSHAFVLETALMISLKKLPERFNLLNRSWLYHKTIKCQKNSAFVQ